jgi:tetratricopeptide (TPR) repeat protein
MRKRSDITEKERKMHAAVVQEKAEAAWKNRQHEQAIALSTEAIQLDPDSLPAYEVRIMAYIIKRQYDLAINDAGEILKLNPASSLAYAIRGESYRMKGRNDLAISDANEALRINPKSVIANETKKLLNRTRTMQMKPAGVHVITAAAVEYETVNRISNRRSLP